MRHFSKYSNKGIINLTIKNTKGKNKRKPGGEWRSKKKYPKKRANEKGGKASDLDIDGKKMKWTENPIFNRRHRQPSL